MFDFIKIFPHCYQDCFEKPGLLPQYLQEPEFVHAVERLLYESQVAYFRNDPDCISEFLLEYRDTLLRALERFEQQEISLESYIGFLLKTYRKNFAKIKHQQQEREEKIYVNYSDMLLERSSVKDYLNNEPEEQIWDPAADNYFSLRQVPSKNIGRYMLYMAQEIIHRQNSQVKNKMEFYKVLRILLLCSEIDITERDLEYLLPQARFSKEKYDILLERREVFLQKYRIKRNEAQRKLQRSYLNYLAKQRQIIRKQPSEAEQKILYSLNELQKSYRSLTSLRFRYLHMGYILTFRQVSDLTEIAEGELRRYYRNLKSYAWLFQGMQENI